MEIKEIKKKLKDRMSLGLNYGLKSIEEALDENSSLINEFISLKSQYNDLNRIVGQNTLEYNQIELGFNKIRNGLLVVIESIQNEDLVNTKSLPALKNNEVQYRKNNFFQLLDIHFINLDRVVIVLTSSSTDERDKDIRKGRDAIRFIYKDIFVYDYKNPRSDAKHMEGKIIEFSKDFFTTRYHRLEVYMKTVKFILEYILEEELEQAFFLGAFKSVLSSHELNMIFYYAISLDKEFAEQLVKSNLIDDAHKDKLIEATHFYLLK